MSTRFFLSPFSLGIVVSAVIFAGAFGAMHIINVYNLQNCDKRFYLLNERRRCEKDEPPKSREYDELMNVLTKKIDEWNTKGEASLVSVHFRDLKGGALFGINSLERFAPASLLKVPVMISLLKYAEEHPEILKEEIQMGANIPPGQNVFDPEKTLEPNKTYTVGEILRRMIVFSDNSSKEVLRAKLEQITPGMLDQTFVDLGISLQNADGSQFITVKSYASLFRILYNASYLDRDMSEMALELLSKSEFPDGIEAGVAKDIVVAHKFGYLDVSEDNEQLHDCGIVYNLSNPYLLCIMTRGRNTETLKSIIVHVSETVFSEVSLQHLAK